MSADSVKPIGEAPAGQLDEESQSALTRFARFIHRERDAKKKKSAPAATPSRFGSANPYRVAEEREAQRESLGQSLDVFA